MGFPLGPSILFLLLSFGCIAQPANNSGNYVEGYAKPEVLEKYLPQLPNGWVEDTFTCRPTCKQVNFGIMGCSSGSGGGGCGPKMSEAGNYYCVPEAGKQDCSASKNKMQIYITDAGPGADYNLEYKQSEEVQIGGSMPELADFTQNRVSIRGYDGTIDYMQRKSSGINNADLVILINKRVRVEILTNMPPAEQGKLLDIASRIDLAGLDKLSR